MKRWKGVFILEARLSTFPGMKNMCDQECTNCPKLFATHPDILGARRVTRIKLHTEYPQLLCATVQCFVARVTWRYEFVYLCVRIFFFIRRINGNV